MAEFSKKEKARLFSGHHASIQLDGTVDLI